jgi:hypothetical protein
VVDGGELTAVPHEAVDGGDGSSGGVDGEAGDLRPVVDL